MSSRSRTRRAGRFPPAARPMLGALERFVDGHARPGEPGAHRRPPAPQARRARGAGALRQGRRPSWSAPPRRAARSGRTPRCSTGGSSERVPRAARAARRSSRRPSDAARAARRAGHDARLPSERRAAPTGCSRRATSTRRGSCCLASAAVARRRAAARARRARAPAARRVGQTTANAWGVLALERSRPRSSARRSRARRRRRSAGREAPARLGGRRRRAARSTSRGRRRATRSRSPRGRGRAVGAVEPRAAVPLARALSSGYRIGGAPSSRRAQKTRASGLEPRRRRARAPRDRGADASWVVVDDPIPAGATLLGSGLGGDSALVTAGERDRRGVWPAFTERGSRRSARYYEWVPKGTFTLEYTVRLNQAGRFAAAADARRGDVLAREDGRAAERRDRGRPVSIGAPGPWAPPVSALLARRRAGRALGRSSTPRAALSAAVRARHAAPRLCSSIATARCCTSAASTRAAAPRVDAARRDRAGAARSGVAAEDRRFRAHGGVDARAVAGAVAERARRRGRAAARARSRCSSPRCLDPGSRAPRRAADARAKLRQMRRARALERAGARTRSSRHT